MTGSFRRGFNKLVGNTLGWNDVRRQMLFAKMERTEMGRALLGYAADNKITFGFSHEIDGKEESYQEQDEGRGGINVMLNADLPDDKLPGAMAEALCRIRNEKAVPLPDAIPSPEAAVLMQRNELAARCAFRQKFVEDYAEKTGDDRPLRASIRPDILEQTRALDDASRFVLWNRRLGIDGHDQTFLGVWNDAHENNKSAADPLPLMPEKDSMTMMGSLAQRYCDSWPVPPDGGKSYLHGVKPERIAAIHPVSAPGFDAAQAEYAPAARAQEEADTARLAALKDRFGKSKAGRAILDYLDEQKIEVVFDHTLDYDHHNGGAGDGRIHLSPAATDDQLMGTLAHEARHIRVHEISGHHDGLTPEAAIAYTRADEADAFAFEHKFLENYARETNDRGPLQTYLKHGPLQGQEMDPDISDADRFRAYCASPLIKEAYDAEVLDRMEKIVPGTRAPLPTAAELDRLLADKVRAQSEPWVLPPQGGPENFTAALSDAQILATTKTGQRDDPAQARRLDALNAAYETARTDQHEECAHRLDALKARIGHTPAGRALLQQAEDSGIDIRIGHPSAQQPPDDNKGHILLDPRIGDDGLMAAAVGRLRLEISRKRSPDTEALLSPEAHVGLDRLRRADALSFAEKFLEGHARAANDADPLESLHAGYGPASPPGSSDAARLKAWSANVSANDMIAGHAAETWAKEAKAATGVRRVLSAEASEKVVTGFLRSLDPSPLAGTGAARPFADAAENDLLEMARDPAKARYKENTALHASLLAAQAKPRPLARKPSGGLPPPS